MRIAGWQHPGEPGDVDGNLAALEDAARRAAAGGARLLVTPEMFLTGYNIGARVAELAREPLEDRVADVARRTGVALAVGLPLPAPGGADGVTNSVLLLDETGRRLARYDKTHLFGDLDRSLFVPGDRPVVTADLDGVRLAFLVCYDVEFPETVRAAALAGTDLVLVPTAQMEPFAFVAEHLVRVRAWENQVYLAYVNHSGAEGDLRYVGRSSISAPSGDVLAFAAPDGEDLLFADVDPAVVRAAHRDNPYLTDLRPEFRLPADPAEVTP
ncbi:carbon-nitrogen hydrolase family protein [Kineococcus sp. SYSU DK002]|uniref:carbon-nitrogen hydrolase family protein n=1 Tax=Kineococcus sp. SYSU DK002 TaxID=3383123 RepID=UPI003D7E41C5